MSAIDAVVGVDHVVGGGLLVALWSGHVHVTGSGGVGTVAADLSTEALAGAHHLLGLASEVEAVISFRGSQ